VSIELTLLTWNIDQWPRGVPPRHKQQRLDQVRDELGRFDVVCLQECWSRRAQQLCHASPHHHLDTLRSRFDYGSGLLTLSRHPQVRIAHERYRASAFPDSMAAKGMTLTGIDVPGFARLDVVNTHLQARRFPRVRVRQMRQLAAFIREHRSDAPLLVAGDLNATQDSEEMHCLRDSLTLRDLLEERPVPRTPTGDGPHFGGGAGRIDHVLLLPGHGDVEVSASGAVGEAPLDRILASDHRGLYTRLRLTRGSHASADPA
jgi:endonuclease/exonuclease/phosphatase family metal-dependent hydrolase